VPEDPYADPVTGVLRNKLGLSAEKELAAADIERLTYFFGEINAIHPFREGNGRAQRAFLEQLAGEAGFVLDWQLLDADRNIAASDAIMRGNPAPMREVFDELVGEL
jgi:fido (protein-threonine AMPylation protein)